jgi:hypothetical protein
MSKLAIGTILVVDAYFVVNCLSLYTAVQRRLVEKNHKCLLIPLNE